MNIYQTIAVKEPNRSEIFSAYNRVRAIGRRGRLDLNRINRALGLLISQSITGKRPEEEDFRTTKRFCSCPDRRFRKTVCKHMIALYMLEKIEKARGS